MKPFCEKALPKTYDVVYADPPWRYNFSKSNRRKIENQYPTMSLEDIKNLQLSIADNAVCFLWATAPKLLEALEVLKAWGFTYKTHAIWDKQVMGMGYWFRGQHELLLVGVKGKFSPPTTSQRIRSICSQKRTRHSKKPDFVRNLIAEWYPNHNKIELFARDRFEGWDVCGNEVPTSEQKNIYWSVKP